MKNKINLSILLFAKKLKLIVIIILLTSCITTKERIENTYATSIHYFDTNNYFYQQFRSWGINKNYIIEINEPVSRIEELFSSNIISFSVANMPADVENILRFCSPEDDSYIDYYDYVAQNADRIILLPNIKGMFGFVMTTHKDSWPYESESLIYLNVRYLRSSFLGSARPRNAAIMIIHEAAHKELSRLMEEGRVSYGYYGKYIGERYALIKEIEFREKINWHCSETLVKLQNENRYFGRPLNDRTLFFLDE